MRQHLNARAMRAAARALARLNDQADEVRAELLGLQRDVAAVQQGFREVQGAQLMEANERLLISALHAETIAESAERRLDEVARSSQRDTLTDTPNRALMLDRRRNAIAMGRRHGSRLAVLFLDLDNFKQINDGLGHAAGDEALQWVARRLESIVRDSDTVSRHGGDELLVLLAEISKASDAALIAAKMLAALAALGRVGNHELSLSASLGIAIFRDDGPDAATLISHADAAMYRSKKRGPGWFAFYREQIATDRSPAPSPVDVL